MVGMYRVGDNSIINRFFRNARLKSVDSLITKFEVKSLIKALKAKKSFGMPQTRILLGKILSMLTFLVRMLLQHQQYVDL